MCEYKYMYKAPEQVPQSQLFKGCRCPPEPDTTSGRHCLEHLRSHSPFCSPQHLTTFVDEGLPTLPPTPMQVIGKLPKPGGTYIV